MVSRKQTIRSFFNVDDRKLLVRPVAVGKNGNKEHARARLQSRTNFKPENIFILKNLNEVTRAHASFVGRLKTRKTLKL